METVRDYTPPDVQSNFDFRALRENLSRAFDLPDRFPPPLPKRRRVDYSSWVDHFQKDARDLTKGREEWKGVDRSILGIAAEHFHAFGKPHLNEKTGVLTGRPFERDPHHDVQLSFSPLGNGAVGIMAEDRSIVSRRLHVPEYSPLGEFFSDTFGLEGVRIKETMHPTESGMTSYGMPVSRRVLEYGAPVRDKKDLLKLLNIARILPAFIKAVNDAAQDRIDALASYAPEREREPFVYGNEWLYEFVERTALEALTRYIQEHPDIRFHLEDVNVCVRSRDLTPSFRYKREEDNIFGPLTLTENLSPVTLKKPLRELLIDTIAVRLPNRGVMYVTLPESARILFTFYFYPWNDNDDESAALGSWVLKSRLNSKVLAWIREHFPQDFRQREKVERREKKDLAYYLRFLSIDRDVFLQASLTDREGMVKKARRKLIVTFHPDRFERGAKPGERDAAEEITKEINEAVNFLLSYR